MDFTTSLGEAGANGAATGPCVFLTLLGHRIVLEDWGCFCYNSEKLGWQLYLLGMRVPCVFKLETIEVEWWLSLLRGWYQ